MSNSSGWPQGRRTEQHDVVQQRSLRCEVGLAGASEQCAAGCTRADTLAEQFERCPSLWRVGGSRPPRQAGAKALWAAE